MRIFIIIAIVYVVKAIFEVEESVSVRIIRNTLTILKSNLNLCSTLNCVSLSFCYWLNPNSHSLCFAIGSIQSSYKRRFYAQWTSLHCVWTSLKLSPRSHQLHTWTKRYAHRTWFFLILFSLSCFEYFKRLLLSLIQSFHLLFHSFDCFHSFRHFSSFISFIHLIAFIDSFIDLFTSFKLIFIRWLTPLIYSFINWIERIRFRFITSYGS